MPVEVTPLLPHFAHAADGTRRVDLAEGRERDIAVLFADIRGFTALAEGRLPYDIVFILNRYFDTMGRAVEQAGGTMDDICRVDVYVRNMEHFDLIHKVRREYFKAPAPASTMVEVCKMTSPDYLIEINAIAVIGE